MSGRGKTGALEARLGYRFKDPALLERALSHRSHAHEVLGDPARSYERLEFLGDALLGFLISDRLFDADPTAGEGILTRRKQLLVSTPTLARRARELGLGQALRLGRGEAGSGGRDKPSLLADAFEAVLGAVYLDGGVRAARAFVRRHLGDRLRDAGRTGEVAEDYKTRLQEWTQARLRVTPTYRIVKTTGPAHRRRFDAEVRLGRRIVGRGAGASRKQAEQAAARQALRELAPS